MFSVFCNRLCGACLRKAVTIFGRERRAKEDYGVIFITEQIAEKIKETIDRYNDKVSPAIILIPSNQGSLNIGMNRINTNVEKAVGANIL